MASFRHSVALVAAGLTVTACANQVVGTRPAAYHNRSVESENQPVVQHTNYVFDVATGGYGVSRPELARLGDWLDSLQLRYGDSVYVEDPAGNAEVRADVARLIGRYGMLLNQGVPLTVGSVPFGSARIIVARASASVPGCPNWREGRSTGNSISTDSNYGCAMNSNLAAMVANPDDLIAGQTGAASVDAQTATKAIKQYRDAPPTGAQGLTGTSTTQKSGG